MLELADIFRLHGAAYRARFGDRLLPSHAGAMRDIQADPGSKAEEARRLNVTTCPASS